MRPSFIVMIAVLVTGCAGSMGTPRPGPSLPASEAEQLPAPAPPVTAFDGVYATNLRIASAFGSADSNSWCDTRPRYNVSVSDGQFTYPVPHPNVPGNPTPVFAATVASDGSFSGEIVAGAMYGRIDGRHMEGTINGSGCIYAFSGNRE